MPGPATEIVLRSGPYGPLETEADILLDWDRKQRRTVIFKADILNATQLELRREREVYSAYEIDPRIVSGLYRRSYNPLAGRRPTCRGRYSLAQDPWRQDTYESLGWSNAAHPSYSREEDRIVEGGQHYTWDIMLPHRAPGLSSGKNPYFLLGYRAEQLNRTIGVDKPSCSPHT